MLLLGGVLDIAPSTLSKNVQVLEINHKWASIIKKCPMNIGLP